MVDPHYDHGGKPAYNTSNGPPSVINFHPRTEPSLVTPVVDIDAPLTIADASAIAHSRKSNNKSVWICLGFMGVIVIGLVAYVVYRGDPCLGTLNNSYARGICETINSVAPQLIRYTTSPTTADEQALHFLIHNDTMKTNEQSLRQRFALYSLWFHTNEYAEYAAPRATNWNLGNMSGMNECDWFSIPDINRPVIECEDSDTITKLKFGWDPVVGVQDLADIMSIVCFVGSLPTNLGMLVNLKELVLNGQDFQDSRIPDSLYQLPMLEVFSVATSRVAGPLGIHLFNSKKLRVLDLSRNRLTGEIHSGIGNLQSAEHIRLDNNELRGNIPSSVSSLHKMKFLLLQDNNLSGMIPAGIAMMTHLETLRLSGNIFLTGMIPRAISGLRQLRMFHAFNTDLKGPNPLCPASTQQPVLEDIAVDCNKVIGGCWTQCCDGKNSEGVNVCQDVDPQLKLCHVDNLPAFSALDVTCSCKCNGRP